MEVLKNTVTTYIYTLNDPVTGEIKYVGKSDDPNKRYSQHLSRTKKHNSYKNNWISSLLNEDKKPVLEILDEVDKNNWGFWESYWISLVKSWGFKLTNLTDGGEGGNFGPAVNKKISEKLKGRVYSEETIARMRKSAQNRKLTEEGRKNLSIHRMGKGNSMYGKKQSKYCIESKYKSVIQLTTDGEEIKTWKSFKSITENLQINRHNIRSVCNGVRKTAGGFKWKWNHE